MMPRIVPYTRAQSGRGRRGETVTTELDLSTAWGLYDRQVRFVTSSALFSLFLGGVGSGKSHALTAWIIRRALANPNGVGALLGRTSIDLQTVLLPSLFDRLAECQQNCGVSLVANYDKGNAKLRFVNGCVVYFRPFNRIAKVRGLTLTFAGADEVEKCAGSRSRLPVLMKSSGARPIPARSGRCLPADFAVLGRCRA